MNKRSYNGVLSTIGNTPLVKLQQLFAGVKLQVFAKLEFFNPGGSIKDRTALNILNQAATDGVLNRDTTVIESSSGNMAIGLAQICLKWGLKFIAVVDPNINHQTEKILKAYGAQINKVSSTSANGNFLQARLNRVQQLLLTTENSFWPNQYNNPHNPDTHRQTMHEIAIALNKRIDYLLVATSTCGTLMGCARYIREHQMNTKLIAVDAVGSVIFQPLTGQRLIPGHGAGKPSKFLDKSMVDRVVYVNDLECVQGCRQLLKHEAILAGGSSGALVMAMEKIKNEIPDGANVAMLICDNGERYLDTIYNPEWVAKTFEGQEMEGEIAEVNAI